MLKMYTTEKFVKHTSNLLQFWGGYGYMWEYPIAKSWAGARVTSIYTGSNEMMREIISRKKFAIPDKKYICIFDLKFR